MVDIDTGLNSPFHFRQVLASDPTKALLLLQQQQKYYDHVKEEDIIQICPEAWDISFEIGKRIKSNGGLGLFIDYGSLNIRDSRLRGIKNHKWVSPFSTPGEVDLSSDVEFASLKNAAEAGGNTKINVDLYLLGARSFGPITQKDFLMQMGIQQRLLDLLKSSKSAAEGKDLVRACDRLVSPDEMGNIYNFFAIGNCENIYGFP